MAREKEIKIKLKDMTLDEFEQRIKEKGFELQRTIRQTDVYFDTKDWFLYDHIAALRLRLVEGADESFSFKKVYYLPKKADKHYVEEIEAKFPLTDLKVLAEIFERVNIHYANEVFESGEDLVKFLAKFGYLDEQRMPKIRKIFKKDDSEMVIDDVDQVGIVIELECEESEPLETIRSVLEENEWERSYDATGYAWLKVVKGLDRHGEHLERLKNIPDWNVWSWEKKMYGKLAK